MQGAHLKKGAHWIGVQPHQFGVEGSLWVHWIEVEGELEEAEGELY